MRAALAGASFAGIGLLLASASVGAAATLSEVKSGGALHVCANPEGMPFTSQDPAVPGIQLELAEAIARALGTKPRVSWVYGPRAVRLAGCEVLMSAVGSAESRGPVRLTRPYFGTGYVLLRPRGTDGAKSFEELRGQKIGVQVQSVAQWVLTDGV